MNWAPGNRYESSSSNVVEARRKPSSGGRSSPSNYGRAPSANANYGAPAKSNQSSYKNRQRAQTPKPKRPSSSYGKPESRKPDAGYGSPKAASKPSSGYGSPKAPPVTSRKPSGKRGGCPL